MSFYQVDRELIEYKKTLVVTIKHGLKFIDQINLSNKTVERLQTFSQFIKWFIKINSVML